MLLNELMLLYWITVNNHSRITCYLYTKPMFALICLHIFERESTIC